MNKFLREIFLVIKDSFIYFYKEVKGFILTVFYSASFRKTKDSEESFEDLIKNLELKLEKKRQKLEDEREQIPAQDRIKTLNSKINPPSKSKAQNKLIPQEKIEKKIGNSPQKDFSQEDSSQQNLSQEDLSQEDLSQRKASKNGKYNNQDIFLGATEEYTPNKKTKLAKEINTPKPKYIFFKIGVALIIIFSSFMVYMLWDLPDYKQLSNYEPPITTKVYSADGYAISEFAKEKRSFIDIDDVPQIVKDAFLSAEDKTFYSHMGFDFFGFLRSMYTNMLYIFGKSNNLTGASTITQQVAKVFLLSNDRTIRRKIREAVLTIKIERAFSKDHILELYLNEIYLGRGSYGVASAAINYFGKPIVDLTVVEAAYLAAIPKAPSRYDPLYNYDRAKIRRDYVLNRLAEDGKITYEESLKYIQEPIEAKERTSVRTIKSDYAAEEVRKNLINKFGSDSLYNGGLIVKTTIDYSYQDYAYDALRDGIMEYDQKKGYRGVLSTIITEDSEENKYSILKVDINGYPLWRNLLRANMEVIRYKDIIYPWDIAVVISVTKNHLKVGFLNNTVEEVSLSDNHWAKPEEQNKGELDDFSKIVKVGNIIFLERTTKGLLLRQIPEINGAIIAMNPQSGDILAMQGGYSFLISQFNRATQARRQPGSSFKPFVYLSAIQRGFTSSDLFLDAPYVSESTTEEDSWKPKNYLGAYNGYITLRYALEFSKNLATIRVANATGLPQISRLVKSLNIYNDDVNNLSEVLGSKETTLLKMVSAYSMLVNGGKKISPNLINLVQDKQGDMVYKSDNRACPNCQNIPWLDQSPPELLDNRVIVVDARDAFIITNLLQGAVDRGSGRRARIAGYNIGGKTGTTNDSKDAWFIGFSPDLVVGVYMGADNPKSLGGNEESGATLALPIFAKFMRKALKTREALPFRTPEGLEMVWVDYKTGNISPTMDTGFILEVFKEGQAPKESSKFYGEILDTEEEGIY